MRLPLLIGLALGPLSLLTACCNGGGGCLGSVGVVITTPEGAPATILTARVEIDGEVFEVDCDGEVDTGAGPLNEIYCEAPGVLRVWTDEDLLLMEVVAIEGSFSGEVEPEFTDIPIGKERCGVYCTYGDAELVVEPEEEDEEGAA